MRIALIIIVLLNETNRQPNEKHKEKMNMYNSWRKRNLIVKIIFKGKRCSEEDIKIILIRQKLFDIYRLYDRLKVCCNQISFVNNTCFLTLQCSGYLLNWINLSINELIKFAIGIYCSWTLIIHFDDLNEIRSTRP